ncbi:MAG: Crp/Fnr family transcriptional regulator [Pseudomonadota bacterium]
MRESESQPDKTNVRTHIERMLTSKGWLSRCDVALQQQLLKIGRTTQFEPGEVLFRIDDPANGIYGVASGAVHIAMPADDGQELIIYHADTGFWVGDLELFSEEPRMATVTAVAPTLCLVVSRMQLRELLDREPAYYRAFYKMSCENGQTIMRTLANMTVTGSDKRLALRLLQYDENTSDPDGWITIAQNQLALTTALSVPTLERVLRRLAKAGLVEIGYSKLRLLDRTGLQKLTNS